MAIYLSQHGKCYPSETDPERKLTEDGKNESAKTAIMMMDKNIHVSRIIHSGKTRASETAEIFSGYLHPENGISIIEGMDPCDNVETFARNIIFDDTLYVGHLPFMEKLVSYLVAGDLERGVIRFHNSGIVCLDQESSNGKIVIRWTLMP